MFGRYAIKLDFYQYLGVNEMIKFVVVLLITAFMTGCSSSDDGVGNYVKANRYSNCIEKLSDSGNLTYDEMKEVCSEYLK